GGGRERKNDESHKVEQRCPEKGGQGTEHARRNHRRHRVGRIVQPVQEIERQGQRDQQPDGPRQVRERKMAEIHALEKVHNHNPLMTISEMTWATSLHASTVSSNQPYNSRHLINSKMSGGLAKRALSVSR